MAKPHRQLFFSRLLATYAQCSLPANECGSIGGHMLKNVTLSLLILAASPIDSRAQDLLHIGVIAPLTGNSSDQALRVSRGIQIGLTEVNRANEKIVVHYEDAKGADVGQSIQAYRSLRARFKVAAIITYGSGPGVALTPLVNEDRVVQIGVATATPKYRTENDFTFRVYPSSDHEASFLSRAILHDLKAEEIAILSIENDYGVGMASSVESKFVALGGRVLSHKPYSSAETDFRSILLPLRQRPNLYVYLASYPADGALVLKQARTMGLQNRFVSSSGIAGNADFLIVAGQAAEGLVVATTIPSSGSRFAAESEKAFGSDDIPLLNYAARGYDAIKLLELAIDQCGAKDTECFRKTLSEVKGFKGASGELTFDTAGDTTAQFELFQIRNGRFTQYTAE